MTDIDTAARFAADGRRVFQPRPMAGAPDYDALIAEAGHRFGRVHRLLQTTEGRRRLHINDSFAVRRCDGRIVATVGAFNVELSLEEARRTADALSSFVAMADAEDVEVEDMGRAA